MAHLTLACLSNQKTKDLLLCSTCAAGLGNQSKCIATTNVRRQFMPSVCNSGRKTELVNFQQCREVFRPVATDCEQHSSPPGANLLQDPHPQSLTSSR